MNKNSKIFIAGHRGMVGSAILRALKADGFENLIYRTSEELDLRNQSAVNNFFNEEQPEFVFLAAAKVGGINANNIYRGEFLYDNLAIELNVIEAARVNKVKKLLFLGSSCIYPKSAPQPLKEEYLLSGYLESTNEPYAIAKIAGIKLCETYRYQYGCDFISAMPTNLYGPNDNYDLEKSHVLPALLRKFHEAKTNGAKSVTVWGSGKPYREFLHVDDLAAACLVLMEKYDEAQFINIGSGSDLTIRELAEMIKEITGFSGEIIYDTSRPDGTVRKLMDSSKISRLGWSPKIDLFNGISMTYEIFQKQFEKV
jgi:GDP-L-fucose synthase